MSECFAGGHLRFLDGEWRDDDGNAIEISRVRHGRWKRTADGAALCTACKRKMNPHQYGYAFCSLCGAKMDGGIDNG